MNSLTPKGEPKINSRILPEFCYSTATPLVIQGVIVHYFSAINVEPQRPFDMDACWSLFRDLNKPRNQRITYMKSERWRKQRNYASAHVLIGREGECLQLVPYDKRAYHAGKSILNSKAGCNQWTAGIELVGTKTSGFTTKQYRALAQVVSDLMDEHDFRYEYIAGHDTVRHAAIAAGISTVKKWDPSGQSNGKGDNFDWIRLQVLVEAIERQKQSLELERMPPIKTGSQTA